MKKISLQKMLLQMLLPASILAASYFLAFWSSEGIWRYILLAGGVGILIGAAWFIHTAFHVLTIGNAKTYLEGLAYSTGAIAGGFVIMSVSTFLQEMWVFGAAAAAYAVLCFRQSGAYARSALDEEFVREIQEGIDEELRNDKSMLNEIADEKEKDE